MVMDVESDESILELIENGAAFYGEEDLLPAAYEMMEFFESLAPTTLICVRGKNFLLTKEELV
jgi:hypothetical protein